MISGTTDRFRIGEKLIKIERTAESVQAYQSRRAMAGDQDFTSHAPSPLRRQNPHSWHLLRHKRETVWYIFLDGSSIGIAQKLPNGLYTCHRYVERDLRLLACRLVDEDPKTIEELSAP